METEKNCIYDSSDEHKRSSIEENAIDIHKPHVDENLQILSPRYNILALSRELAVEFNEYAAMRWNALSRPSMAEAGSFNEHILTLVPYC